MKGGNTLTQCLQDLPLSSHMLDAKVKAAALQNSALMAGRRQDAVRLQQLIDTDSQLRTILAQQAALTAEQAETIDRHNKVLAHSERHVSIISRLLSKLQGRRRVQAAELDHIVSDSHLEVLEQEKQGLQKTLEETEDELAKERQRNEYARGEAQHRATKRQELQVHNQHSCHQQIQPVHQCSTCTAHVIMLSRLCTSHTCDLADTCIAQSKQMYCIIMCQSPQLRKLLRKIACLAQ